MQYVILLNVILIAVPIYATSFVEKVRQARRTFSFSAVSSYSEQYTEKRNIRKLLHFRSLLLPLVLVSESLDIRIGISLGLRASIQASSFLVSTPQVLLTLTTGVATSPGCSRRLRLGKELQTLVPLELLSPIWTSIWFRNWTLGCSRYELVYCQKSIMHNMHVCAHVVLI